MALKDELLTISLGEALEKRGASPHISESPEKVHDVLTQLVVPCIV